MNDRIFYILTLFTKECAPLLLPPFSFTGIETIIEKMSLFLLSRGEANDKIFCIFTALKKVVFPVSFSRHLFKIIVVSPLFSSSSCIRTRVSSASATTSTTAAPLLSTSLRRYSPSVSVQECFIIISTLSLMGVVDELKAGFRLPPLPPPPPPRPPLEQPIILSPSTPRKVSFHRNRQIWKKWKDCLFPHWLCDWNGRCLNWGDPSMTYDHLLGCLRLGPVASSISEPMPIAARIHSQGDFHPSTVLVQCCFTFSVWMSIQHGLKVESWFDGRKVSRAEVLLISPSPDRPEFPAGLPMIEESYSENENWVRNVKSKS